MPNLPAGFVLYMGSIVYYNDANGNLIPAMITAIRDGVAGVVRLTLFNPGATLTDIDQVSFDPARAPSTWAPIYGG